MISRTLRCVLMNLHETEAINPSLASMEATSLVVMWGHLYSGPVPPVRLVWPVRPWPYQFLKGGNDVAAILTYNRVATSKVPS